VNLPCADAMRGRFGRMSVDVAAVRIVDNAIWRVTCWFILGALLGGTERLDDLMVASDRMVRRK
jgi:hypothetical protein